MTIEEKINHLKTEVQAITEKLTSELNDLTNELDYHNGSRFSYNIDRLERFNKELQEFEIL